MASKSKVVKFRPAGKNDNFIIVGTDINTIIEKEKFELKAAKKGVEILSTEITEKLSIKVYDNEPVQAKVNTAKSKNKNADIVEFKDKKQKIETRNKTTDINEHKRAKQQKDEDRDIG